LNPEKKIIKEGQVTLQFFDPMEREEPE